MRAEKLTALCNATVKKFLRYNSTESTEHVRSSEKLNGTTVHFEDVIHHSKLSSKWWDITGELRALHALNPLRIQFVRDGLANVGFEEVNPCYPLEGVKILDVGCGGGILAEPLARIGAEVTGIDASAELVTTATEHAAIDSNLSGRLTYIQTSVEDFARTNSKAYDAVVASEILEHVIDKELFIKCCADMTKPGGSFFITTFNKTLSSWLGGIIAAEYLLQLAPTGTHDWNKFISPDATRRLLEACGCRTKLIHGMCYNPLKNEWCWTTSTAINYAIHSLKKKEC